MFFDLTYFMADYMYSQQYVVQKILKTLCKTFKRSEISTFIVVAVVSSPHQSPRCGVSRFRSALTIKIPLSVWSASTSPAY